MSELRLGCAYDALSQRDIELVFILISIIRVVP